MTSLSYAHSHLFRVRLYYLQFSTPSTMFPFPPSTIFYHKFLSFSNTCLSLHSFSSLNSTFVQPVHVRWGRFGRNARYFFNEWFCEAAILWPGWHGSWTRCHYTWMSNDESNNFHSRLKRLLNINRKNQQRENNRKANDNNFCALEEHIPQPCAGLEWFIRIIEVFTGDFQEKGRFFDL